MNIPYLQFIDRYPKFRRIIRDLGYIMSYYKNIYYQTFISKLEYRVDGVGPYLVYKGRNLYVDTVEKRTIFLKLFL